MTDRELLELAAKAAGHALSNEWDSATNGILIGTGKGDLLVWNPLTYDGDALRLAVRLGIEVVSSNAEGVSYVRLYEDGDMDPSLQFTERHGTDPLAATRRAIVLAAAEIGRAMP